MNLAIKDINGNKIDLSLFSSIDIRAVMSYGKKPVFVCAIRGNTGGDFLVTLDAENQAAAAWYFINPPKIKKLAA